MSVRQAIASWTKLEPIESVPAESKDISKLLDLPDDILHAILCHIDPETLHRLTWISKRLAALLQSRRSKPIWLASFRNSTFYIPSNSLPRAGDMGGPHPNRMPLIWYSPAWSSPTGTSSKDHGWEDTETDEESLSERLKCIKHPLPPPEIPHFVWARLIYTFTCEICLQHASGSESLAPGRYIHVFPAPCVVCNSCYEKFTGGYDELISQFQKISKEYPWMAEAVESEAIPEFLRTLPYTILARVVFLEDAALLSYAEATELPVSDRRIHFRNLMSQFFDWKEMNEGGNSAKVDLERPYSTIKSVPRAHFRFASQLIEYDWVRKQFECYQRDLELRKTWSAHESFEKAVTTYLTESSSSHPSSVKLVLRLDGRTLFDSYREETTQEASWTRPRSRLTDTLLARAQACQQLIEWIPVLKYHYLDHRIHSVVSSRSSPVTNFVGELTLHHMLVSGNYVNDFGLDDDTALRDALRRIVTGDGWPERVRTEIQTIQRELADEVITFLLKEQLGEGAQKVVPTRDAVLLQVLAGPALLFGCVSCKALMLWKDVLNHACYFGDYIHASDCRQEHEQYELN